MEALTRASIVPSSPASPLTVFSTRQKNLSPRRIHLPLASRSVSNCYVFKSRLQEYAQKTSLPTPVYETIKEGPSHEPSFRSTVIVNDVRYDSLPGFFNRKAAEQSAAEVALLELSKSVEVGERVSQPVYETGLCKNLLQEYAQKMNYAIPLYVCRREELSGRKTLFTCTVEIGGMRYIGAAAGTKKEAEIKAARTALIAIRSNTSESSVKLNAGESQLTVIPCKKRGPETTSPSVAEDAEKPKPKKARIKKVNKRKLPKNQVVNGEAEVSTFTVGQWVMGVNNQNGVPQTLVAGQSQLHNAEITNSKLLEANGSSLLVVHQTENPIGYPQRGELGFISNGRESSGGEIYQHGVNGSWNLHPCSNIFSVTHQEAPVTEMSSTKCGDTAAFSTEAKEESQASEVGGNKSSACMLEISPDVVLA